MKRKFLIASGLLISAILPFVLCSVIPSAFSGWYPQWSRFISGIISVVTGVVPLAVAEILLFALIVALIVYWVLMIRKKHVTNAVVVTLIWLGAFASSFVWLWGLNYFMPTPSQHLGLASNPQPVSELIKTTEYYRDSLNTISGLLPRLSNGVVSYSGFYGTSKDVANSYNKLSKEYDFINPISAPTKPLAFSIIQSYLGIAGVYSPWTGEGCINKDTPMPTLPATMAHETAHRQGVAQEDEANFLGIIACRQSDDIIVQYSGNFLAFIYLSNALSENDASEHKRIWDGLSPQVVSELRLITDYYAQYEGPITEVGNVVNDTYLKIMQQPEGIKSYGLVADLLISERLLKK